MKHLVTLALLAFAGLAHAQSNTVTWQAPTACTTGQPIAQCAVTGYRVERSTAETGPYAPLATVGTVLTYTHANVPEGESCYRVVALSARGESAPSNIACRTYTPPVGPPNPPTNLRVVETTVFNLWMEGREVTLGQVVGRVPLNTICGRQQLLPDARYRTVARSNVTPAQQRGMVLVARCG